MILVDAGPLIALADRADAAHQPCAAALARLREPLATAWAPLAEAMHVLGRRAGWRGQAQLWGLVLAGALDVLDIPAARRDRAREFMEKYRSLPADLGDATLLVLAETHRVRTIFTLDRHFRVYRLARGRGLRVVP